MIIARILLVLVLLLQAVPSVRAGEIFRWLDEDGTPHFTNHLSKVPPTSRDRAEVQSIPDLPRVKPIAPLGSVRPSRNIDMNGHDERWWRKRIQRWRSRKEERTLTLAEVEEKLGRLRFENKTIFFKEAETGRLLRDIEKLKQEIRQAEEALQTALPEEARKAGAPPGWLR